MKTGLRHPGPARRWAFAFLLALTPCLGGCGPGEAAAPPSEPTADAVRREIARTVELEGRVVAPPGRLAQVNSPGTALVRRVHVRPGARVERGEPLVTLDFGTSEALLAEARRELATARENLAAAQDRFDALRRPALTRLEEARKRATGEEGWLLDGAEASSEGGDADVRAAEAALAAIDQQVAHAVLPEEWRVRVATEAVQAARGGAREHTVSAPLDGEVQDLRARVGVQVSSDLPLATIIDVSNLQVEAPVGVDAVGLLQPDLPVELKFPNLPGRALSGSIEEVALDAERPGSVTSAPRPTYLARIDFRNPDGDVLPDMSARVVVKLEFRESALAIPSECVRPGPDGGSLVMVQRDDRWLPVEVTLGLDDGRYVEVESGLREGERVRVPQSAPDPLPLTAGDER